MNKIAIGPGYPEGIIDLDAPPADTLRAMAKAQAACPFPKSRPVFSTVRAMPS